MNTISGNENEIKDPRLQSVVQFYTAFNGRNLALMQKTWADGDAISMNNPLGGIKRGWGEIGAVYQRLFTGPVEVYVEFYDFHLVGSNEMFIICGRERGTCATPDTLVNLKIRTSRVFQKFGEGWKQIHHHGSMDNPDLLTQYQQAVNDAVRQGDRNDA